MLAIVLVLMILAWYATYKLGFYIQPSLAHPANVLGRVAWALIGVPLLWFFLVLLYSAIAALFTGAPSPY